jgi:hypothetical protein
MPVNVDDSSEFPIVLPIRKHYLFSFFLFFTLFFFNSLASAQLVDEVLIKTNNRGYEIEIKFFAPLRYQSHLPNNSGNTLNIQLRPEKIVAPEPLNRTNKRINLSWDKSSGVPVREIIFDAELSKSPSLIVYFIQETVFTVRNSPDRRSIIIGVVSESKTDLESQLPVVDSADLMVVLKEQDSKLAKLLARANSAMINKEYRRAVQLFTKIRNENSGDIRQRAQELLGVAREYNNQLAHAKAEYTQYINDYPEGEGTQRVKQRLAALITAAEKPKDKLRVGRRQQSQLAGTWDAQFYGSFSQTYFRDETTFENEEARLLRSELITDLDFVGRARKGDYDLRTQFIGSYRKSLREEDNKEGEFIPSIMTVEAGHSGLGLSAQLGRQSRTTGGVLGRFDGLHAAYEAGSAVTLHTVLGYPVNTMDRTQVNTEQEFYGASVDVASLWEGWDFNAFYIIQDNAGIKDREAIGGEVRYFDPTKSLFTLVDYDIAYEDLNIFLLIANWSVVDGTTLNLVLDYRNSPILTTTSAIQGQGVETLKELFDTYSEEELNQLALDRTIKSKALTMGLTQQLNEDWQIVGELTVTEFGDTVASGGVEAFPGTGKEYYYSSQLIANSLFYDNDTMILSFRYIDANTADTYSIDGNWRINVSRAVRLNPRLRFDYRENKDSGHERWLARPSIRIDYRLKRWVKLELEAGYEWLDETILGESQKTTGYFVNVGYRVQF